MHTKLRINNLLKNTTCLKLTNQLIVFCFNQNTTRDIHATGTVLSDDMRTSTAGQRRVIGNQGNEETMAAVKYCAV